MSYGCSGAAKATNGQTPQPSTLVQTTPPEDPLGAKLRAIRWVAYAPTHYDPDVRPPVMPSETDLRADLAVLHNAGFDGLVTYGAHFASLPSLARETGFKGMLLGVWDPVNAQEKEASLQAAKDSLVVGIIVGNEGLLFKRYDLQAVSRAVADMKAATHKPVTTTETIDQYLTGPVADDLMALGDFLAPNAHPYHHGLTDPEAAVAWTVSMYDALSKKSGKPVLFKEVGLPSAGESKLSEQNQADYYTQLASKAVCFVYFEAFDMPWKRNGTTEPHWGLFRADRSPKPAASITSGFVDVSRDFFPSGWMGDGELGTRFVEVDPACQSKPHSLPTCYRCAYKPGGPKGWTAVAWQYPENNWGSKLGRDLTGRRRISFWIRGETGNEVVTIKAGGHTSFGAAHPASFQAPEQAIRLTKEWKQYQIPLTGMNLSNVPCAFVWVATSSDNPQGCTFYLDDIRYE